MIMKTEIICDKILIQHFKLKFSEKYKNYFKVLI